MPVACPAEVDALYVSSQAIPLAAHSMSSGDSGGDATAGSSGSESDAEAAIAGVDMALGLSGGAAPAGQTIGG